MQIKFLTVNIWFGGKVWDNLIEFIHQEKPDILAIQEVYDGNDISRDKRFRTIQEFKKEFTYLSHVAFGETVIDTGHGNTPWGNAVLSKFPINSTKTIFFDLPLQSYNFEIDHDPRFASEGMQEAEIEIDNKKVFVYSWHGVWDLHGGDTDKRDLMSNIIVDNIKDKEYVILAGDSNVDDNTNCLNNIEKYLVNVFKGELKSTFNMKYKDSPTYATSIVDKIMVSKNIKVIEKSQPKVDVSDHFPLKTTLDIS